MLSMSKVKIFLRKMKYYDVFGWKLSKYIIIIKVKEMDRKKKDKEPNVEDSMTQRISGEVLGYRLWVMLGKAAWKLLLGLLSLESFKHLSLCII